MYREHAPNNPPARIHSASVIHESSAALLCVASDHATQRAMCSSHVSRWRPSHSVFYVGSAVCIAAVSLRCSSAFCWTPPPGAPAAAAAGRRVISAQPRGAGSTPRLRLRVPTSGITPRYDDLQHCCPTRPSLYGGVGRVQYKRRGVGVSRLRCSAASSSSPSSSGEVLASEVVESAGSDAVR